MGKLCSSNANSGLVRQHAVLFLTIATLCLPLVTSNAWADSATTGGESAGAASGSASDPSLQNVTTSVETSSSSDAQSVGKTTASGKTTSNSDENVMISAGTGDANLAGSTGANAQASSSEKAMDANAQAIAKGSNADDKTVSSSATSTDAQKTAQASSSDGSNARADIGNTNGVIAYTPKGSARNYNLNGNNVALSYDADGNFSLAVAGGQNVSAMVGRSNSADALSSGDLRRIINSVTGGMFASADANGNSVSARARAEIESLLNVAIGKAQVYGMSEAYATVRRSGNEFTVTVHESRNDSFGNTSCSTTVVQKHKHKTSQCLVLRKTIHMNGAKTNHAHKAGGFFAQLFK
jgi:hypothetical protein